MLERCTQRRRRKSQKTKKKTTASQVMRQVDRVSPGGIRRITKVHRETRSTQLKNIYRNIDQWPCCSIENYKVNWRCLVAVLLTLFVVCESHTISLPSCDADTKFLESLPQCMA